MTKGRSAVKRWIAIAGGAQLLLALGLMAAPVSADPLQMLCTPPCAAGSVTEITGSTPTFNLIKQGTALSGTGFLAVLAPTGPAITTMTGGTFEKSISWLGPNASKLGDLAQLNESGMTNYTFASFVSASAQAGVAATSFTVSEFILGAFSSTGGGAAGISGLSLDSLPLGTVLVAWVENSTTSVQCPIGPCVAAQTALSESLTVTGVPEPGSLALFATGLVGVGTLFGTRLFNRDRRKSV